MGISAALALACACSDDAAPRHTETAGAPHASEDAAPGAGGSPEPADAAIQEALGPSYPASEEGLRELVDDILAAAGRGDRAAAFELADSLRIDDPYAYFGRVFGAELGDKLASDYAEVGERTRELVPLLRELTATEGAEIRVESFSRPSARTVGYQARALERMVESTPLYSVRISRGGAGGGFHLWSFVHDGQSFRWAGKMQRVAPHGVPLEVQLGLPEGAEIPHDGDVPDLLELPALEDVRGGE
jgi:hypothetical protein